jgi:hypothetical protein
VIYHKDPLSAMNRLAAPGNAMWRINEDVRDVIEEYIYYSLDNMNLDKGDGAYGSVLINIKDSTWTVRNSYYVSTTELETLSGRGVKRK